MSNLGGKTVSEDTDKDNQGLDTVVAGTNIDNIDSSDPRNPIINATTQAGGQVDSVVGGTNCSVDATDPVNPIVNADTQNNAKVTTKGDLEGFNTVAARIPVGTNGQVLEADSTEALGVKWATPSGGSVQGAKVKRSTNQVETVSTYTVDFTTEDYDDAAHAVLGTNADRLQADGATRCNVSAYVRFSVIDDDTRIRIVINRHNSSDVFQETVAAWEGNTSSTVAHISCAAFGSDCSGTDFYEVVVFAADTTTTVSEASFVIQNVSP